MCVPWGLARPGAGMVTLFFKPGTGMGVTGLL